MDLDRNTAPPHCKGHMIVSCQIKELVKKKCGEDFVPISPKQAKELSGDWTSLAKDLQDVVPAGSDDAEVPSPARK